MKSLSTLVALFSVAFSSVVFAQNAQLKPTVPATASPKPADKAGEKAPPIPNEPTITTAEFGGWVVRCVRLEGGSDQKLCETLQSVVIEGQSRPLTRIAIARLKGNDVQVTIVAPHDLTLASPARIVLNNKEQTAELKWTRCLPIGCLAEATVNDAVLSKWRSQTENGAMVLVGSDGKAVDVPLAFRGLSQALDHLAKAQ